jgi:thiamine transport system permease protein
LVTVPFVLPTVVVGAAFLALVGRGGLLGLELDGTAWAVILAHVFFNHAVVVRTVGGLWEGLDPATGEAARVLGASPWRTWWAVTLPALRPAIQSAALVVFLFTFTSFGIVQVLGGSRHVTLEVEIYRQTAQLLDLPVASVLAILQLLCVAVVLVLQDRLSRRWRDEGVLSAPPRLRPSTRRQRAWVAGNLGALGLLLGGPLAVLVERSFRTGRGHGLGNWRALAHRRSGTGLFVPPLEAVGTSLRFA